MHEAVRTYINWLKEAKTAYLTTENKVLYGGTVLVVLPSIESNDVDSIRLDMPTQLEPYESPAWTLFFVAIFGSEKFCEILPRIKSDMHTKREFNEMISGWDLRLFWEDDYRVCLAQALYQV